MEARIEILERNNTELWNKHDQCDEERKKHAVQLANLQGNQDLLNNKIQNIETSTSKIESVVMKMSDKVDDLATHDARSQGAVIGVKELIGIGASIAAIVGVYLGLS